MIIGSPAERSSSEARVALTPESAKQLQKLGHECIIQKGRWCTKLDFLMRPMKRPG